MDLQPATITQQSPLRVQLDVALTDSSGVLVTGSVVAGDRVWVTRYGTQVLVFGGGGVSAGVDTRYEWQSVASTSVPLYMGTAAPGTATSAASWRIEKYTYITGPGGGAVPSLVEAATGAWDDRATLF